MAKTTSLNEQSYIEGERAAWRRILSEACKELGYQTGEGALGAALIEREQAIAALRAICREHGDNDWHENGHLAEIIEKHLGRHL